MIVRGNNSGIRMHMTRRLKIIGMTGLMAVAFSHSALAQGTIMGGLVDLPRSEKTAQIDGCTKTVKGLVMGGGFMLFTCEKLLPHYPIKEHMTAFNDYKKNFTDSGWTSERSAEPAKNKVSFAQTDAQGCKKVVDMELWVDRSMNEPGMDMTKRDNHRQIVFKAWFRGPACESYYGLAEILASR